MSDLKRISWVKFAKQHSMDVRTLKKNCKGIQRRLNAMCGNSNYRILLPKQQELIIKHLGLEE